MKIATHIRYILFAAMLFAVQAAAWGQTAYYYYVKENATGTGTSWSNASGDLQQMIDMAYSQIDGTANTAEIWVAAGIYYPQWVAKGNNTGSITYDAGTAGTTGTARDRAFVIRPNVKIYGGFAGNESSLGDRDWKAKPTTLSGNIGDLASEADNCYHVIIAVNNGVNNATLDGFVIKDANSLNLPGNTSISINSSSVVRRSGAGIYIINSSLYMNNLDFRENAALGSGGAICAEVNSSVNVELSNSTIRGNRANIQGSGIYSSNTSWIMTNVLISGNTASNSNPTPNATGGGISFGGGGTPTLTNVTIAGNYANNNSTGGINGGSNAILYNTIVWGNATGAGTSITNGIASGAICHNCLIQGAPTLSTSSTNIINPSIFNQREDYIFKELKKATGSTPTIEGDYRMRFIRPAIDKGNDSHVPVGITTDLDGNPRIHNGTVDIGAYEYQEDTYTGKFYVKKGATGQGSSWNNASGDLQLMIDMAAAYGDTVFVAKGNYIPQEIKNNTGSVATAQTSGDIITSKDYAFVLRPDVKIFGGFDSGAVDGDGMDTRNWLINKTILDGEGDRYHVVLSVGDVGSAILDGFVITGGYADQDSRISINGQFVIRRTGAGIYAFYSAPTLNNLDICDNYSIGYGGGLCIEYSHNASAVLTNSMIRGNTAEIGGGGIADISNNSQTRYINIAITDNTVTNTSNSGNTGGGGFYATSNVATNSVMLTNATIVNNSGLLGGGIRITGLLNAAVFQNTIVWNNGVSGNNITYSHSAVTGLDLSGSGNNLDATLYTVADIFEDASTGNYHLKRNSPCIDTGEDSYNPLLTDLEGNARIYNGTIDMGAYEKFLIIITDVTEDYAPVTGGKAITIEGNGLLAAGMTMTDTDVWIKLCGVPATIVSITNNKIVCIVRPSNHSMFGSIELSNGIESTEFPKLFTYYPVNFIVNGLWSEPYNWETQTDDRIMPYPDAAVHIMANCLQDIDVAVDSITVHPLKAYTLTKELNANVFTLTDNASFINTGTTLADSIQQNVVRTLKKERNWYISSPVQASTADAALGTGTAGEDLANAHTVDLSSIIAPSTWRVEWYDEDIHNWERLPLGSPLNIGRGYTAHSKTEDIAAKFSGKYNDGDFDFSLQAQNDGDEKQGFNLVGNPFPSYWRWTEETAAAANVYSTIWYRTVIEDNYEFWSYNAAGDVSVAPGWNNNTPTGYYSLAYIPPTQAFWVRVKKDETPNDLTFHNSLRSHADHTSNIAKSAVAGAPAIEGTGEATGQQIVRIVISGSKNIDEALIYIHDKAKNSFDDYDSDKWFTGKGVEVFTLPGNENRELVINGLPGISEGMEIPLGFQSDEGGNFSFSAKAIQNLDDYDIFLHDKWLNIEFNLRTDGAYNFASGQSTNTERFSIRFSSNYNQTAPGEANDLIAYSDGGRNIVALYNGDEAVEVKAYNVAGKVIAVQTIEPKTPTIINSNFVEGVYVLRARNYTAKVMVK